MDLVDDHDVVAPVRPTDIATKPGTNKQTPTGCVCANIFTTTQASEFLRSNSIAYCGYMLRLHIVVTCWGYTCSNRY